MNQHRKGHIVIGLTFATVIAITLYNTSSINEETRERVVKQEDVYCISAICLSDERTNKCLELNPTVSHIIITDDSQIQDASRLIVKPTENFCGRGSLIKIESGGN